MRVLRVLYAITLTRFNELPFSLGNAMMQAWHKHFGGVLAMLADSNRGRLSNRGEGKSLITGDYPLVYKPRIGEILIEAGLIRPSAFQECLAVSKNTAQPVGRVCTMLQHVSERDVENALVVQSMMCSSQLKAKAAIETLKEAARKKVAVIELLRTFGSGTPSQSESAHEIDNSDLGKFLLDCRAINQDQLKAARAQSWETHVPLVRSLLLSNAISVAFASKVLSAIVQVKTGRIGYTKAAVAIQQIMLSGGSLQDVLAQHGVPLPPRSSSLLLGEMLTRSGLITDTDMVCAVERSICKGKKLGEILVDHKIVEKEAIEKAVEIQELFRKGAISPDKAILCLRAAVKDNKTVAEAGNKGGFFQEDSQYNKPIISLLTEIGALTDKAMFDAYREMAAYRMDVLRAVLATELVSLELFTAAEECAKAVSDGILSRRYAAPVLRACQIEHISFKDACALICPELRDSEFLIEEVMEENFEKPATNFTPSLSTQVEDAIAGAKRFALSTHQRLRAIANKKNK